MAANKSDLFEIEQVPEEQARKFAEEIGAIFKLTSACASTGVEELFVGVGCKFLDSNYKEDEKNKIKNLIISSKDLKNLRKQLNQIKEEKRILEEENKRCLQKLEEKRKAHLQKLEAKDKKRNEEKKKDILKKQLESRTKASSNSQKKDKSGVIKDMCILSDITKKEIIEEKKTIRINSEKYKKLYNALIKKVQFLLWDYWQNT